MKKKKKSTNIDVYNDYDDDSDEYFYYIAGYTSNGVPFGITWEEAIEDRLVESSSIANENRLNKYGVTKKLVENNSSIDDIIDEFLTTVESEIRDRLNKNYKIAKDEDQKILKPINQNIKELMLNGNCISYAEIFDNVETFTFRDDNDNLIYIDDQYCMSPMCHCNETFLSFIEIDELQGKAKSLFTLRYSLKKEKCDIEFESLNEEEVKSIVKSFKAKEKQIRGKLKRRYDDMKSIGTKINDEDKIKIVPQINDTKVGRNDICPCGSGKKYKKCCGK